MRERSDLRRLDRRAMPPKRDEIRAFMLVRNEIQLLPFTLAHHRALGVHRFFVVDNGSSDGTIDFLLAETDVHVLKRVPRTKTHATASIGLSCCCTSTAQNCWCLLLDADEHLVYPECETVGLPQFCRALEERGLNCLATSFIDLYADCRYRRHASQSDKPPIEICPFFDSRGYHYFPFNASHVPRIFGGPRARLFWPEIDLAGYCNADPVLRRTRVRPVSVSRRPC